MSTHHTTLRHFSSERDRLADMMWLLFSLANLTLTLSAPGQRVGAHLYWMLHRSENAAFSVAFGDEAADDLSLMPAGGEPMPLPHEDEREATMLHLANSFLQSAWVLATFLAAFPRAFRGRIQSRARRLAAAPGLLGHRPCPVSPTSQQSAIRDDAPS